MKFVVVDVCSYDSLRMLHEREQIRLKFVDVDDAPHVESISLLAHSKASATFKEDRVDLISVVQTDELRGTFVKYPVMSDLSWHISKPYQDMRTSSCAYRMSGKKEKIDN